MFLLSDTCCHFACVCVCASVCVIVVVCRLCLALFIAYHNRGVYFFLRSPCVFHMLVTFNLLSCALITKCLILPACLPACLSVCWLARSWFCLARLGWAGLAWAGLGLFVITRVICLLFSHSHSFILLHSLPLGVPQKNKVKWCVMASRDMCHICYPYAVLTVFVACLTTATHKTKKQKKKTMKKKSAF